MSTTFTAWAIRESARWRLVFLHCEPYDGLDGLDLPPGLGPWVMDGTVKVTHGRSSQGIIAAEWTGEWQRPTIAAAVESSDPVESGIYAWRPCGRPRGRPATDNPRSEHLSARVTSAAMRGFERIGAAALSDWLESQ